MISLIYVDSLKISNTTRELIKQRIKELNLTLPELGKQTKTFFSFGYLNKILYSKKKFSVKLEKITYLLDVLDLNIEDVFKD